MAKKPKEFPTDPSVLTAYKHMISGVDGVELKGATVPYTSLNGHMYSSVSKANRIGLRLSKDERNDFIEKHETTLFEALPGFFQKEYVAIPVDKLNDTAFLQHWFRRSHAYVSSLKPKKTTR